MTIDKARMKDKLLSLRAELEQVSESAEQSRASIELDQTKVGRLSRMDALQQQAMDQAIETRRRNELTRIKAALERLDDGEYGYCIKCGDEIAIERLEFDPTAPLCAKCAT